MKTKIKGIDSLHSHVNKECPNCGLILKARELEDVICSLCLTTNDVKIVLVKTIKK